MNDDMRNIWIEKSFHCAATFAHSARNTWFRNASRDYSNLILVEQSLLITKYAKVSLGNCVNIYNSSNIEQNLSEKVNFRLIGIGDEYLESVLCISS